MRTIATLVVAAACLTATAASAQVLGTYRWQTQPYCNLITVTVTQVGGAYRLEGTDNQCGAATGASVIGMAFPNPNGTIGFGVSIVASPGGSVVALEAAISLSTLNGTWRDSAGGSGSFVFTQGLGTGGTQRLTTAPGVQLRIGGLSGTQAIGGTVTPVTTWNPSPTYNHGGGTYNPSTGSYTVPAAGLYTIKASVYWSGFAAVSGYKCVTIAVNTARVGTSCELPSASLTLQYAATDVLLNSGDVVDVRVWQTSGGAASIGVGGLSTPDIFWTVSRLR